MPECIAVLIGIIGIGLLWIGLTWAWLNFTRNRRSRAAVPSPAILDDHVRAVRLFNITAKLLSLAEHGKRVRFVRDVDRSPDFVVKKGETGEILVPLSDPKDNLFVIRIKLDNPPPGAEKFHNEIHWKEGINEAEFQKDIDFYDGSG